MDIWNSSNHILSSSNAAANSASTDPMSTAYDNSLQTFTSSISSPNEYKSKFSNVEMDPLAYQMLQLSTAESLSQLTTPSIMQNSYFGNSFNNRHLSDASKINELTYNSNNNNNSSTNTNTNTNTNNNSNNKNNNNTQNIHSNTNNSNSNSNTNASNWSNNPNSYSNYLMQQSQNQNQSQSQSVAQAQAQAAAQAQIQAQAQAQVQNTFTNQIKLKMKQQQLQQQQLQHQTQQSLTSSQSQSHSQSQPQLQSQQNPHSYMNQQSHSNLNINSFQYENIKPDNNINNNNNNRNFNINQFDSRVLKQNNQLKNSINNNDSSEIENIKNKLQLKDIIISKLESELEKSKDFRSTLLKTQSESNGKFEIPKNYEDLYHKLVEKIQSTESELNDTKMRLEALVTAISMNPNPSAFKNGRYDEEEISHKIISKLKMLTEENDELSRMVSYGKSKEKDIEIALLRKQNSDLLEKMAKLESKLADKK